MSADDGGPRFSRFESMGRLKEDSAPVAAVVILGSRTRLDQERWRSRRGLGEQEARGGSVDLSEPGAGAVIASARFVLRQTRPHSCSERNESKVEARLRDVNVRAN